MSVWEQVRSDEPVKLHAYLSKLQRSTLASAAPVARLTAALLCDTVARGCHASPPTLSLWPLSDIFSRALGISQRRTPPLQLPVARILALGEKRTRLTGRVSPTWDPRLVYSRMGAKRALRVATILAMGILACSFCDAMRRAAL